LIYDFSVIALRVRSHPDGPDGELVSFSVQQQHQTQTQVPSHPPHLTPHLSLNRSHERDPEVMSTEENCNEGMMLRVFKLVALSHCHGGRWKRRMMK
jgi:hypothetical protein